MLQYLSQEQQARKKVFFKPEISSEMKFTPSISPQFVSDTNLFYMSAYDFMSYNTDEESFSLLHRPLPSQQDLKRVKQQFVNVNFGRSSRERANEIFYVIKNTSENEQKYFLGRRMNSVNHDYERRLIAENKKVKKKSFHVEDLDNFGNVKQVKKKPKVNENQVPNGILEFQKQFIIKPSLSLIVFVVKKEEKQPEIKLSVKNISEEGEEWEEEFENPSLPPTIQYMKEQNSQKILQKRYKNHLLIHSYSQNQTMTFQLQESIEFAFQVLEGSPNLICTTQKFVYLLNFEVKSVYVPSHKQSGFILQDKSSYHDSSRGYLNSDIKVQILDKVELEFYIKTEELLNKNLLMSNNNCEKSKKRYRKNKSLALNSIINDRRVSSLLKPPQTVNSEQSHPYLSVQDLQNRKMSNSKLNSSQQSESSVKVIKKALQILPLSFHQQEFVLIVYVISRVLFTNDSIETLSMQYESEILSVQPTEIFEINFEQNFAKERMEVFVNARNGVEETSPLARSTKGQANVLNCISELGGIAVNKGVILIWERFEPVIHQIVYRMDYHTNEMLDLSDPKNLRSQKTILQSINHILEYRNKITLFLDSNLIRQVIISPTSQNFLILTGRNHLNNQYHDSESQNIDHRPEDIDEKYDIDGYLIFQYDLYAELWSSDASVYLKNIPLCYQKRKVQEIAPFTLKEEVLALTGKTVHEMHKSLLDGVLDFDLHPYGYFVAVSFGFNAKIYSLEHNTLNLMYTFNAQGIRKIKYSPNGSDIVIMSQKFIKILDAYSFAIKYILPQKNSQSSFTNFAFTSLGYKFCSVYDQINITIYDGKSYKKLQSIKPGQSSLLNIHEKIQTIVLDTQQRFIFALLESGKIYFKWDEDVVVIKHEKVYEYSDGKLINCVHYDSKQGVLFCGSQDGIVRAHIWPIVNPSYSFDTYSQFKFGYSLITAIKSSKLANTVYVGDINGNLTTSKFIVQKEKKITGELRPNNYYIFSSYSPMINMPRSQLENLEKCYKFVLGTNNETEDGQKMKLEYKFTEIITKMNDQMKRFKKQLREKLTQRQQMAKGKINFSMLYNSQKAKLTEINRELRYQSQKCAQEKQVLANKYDIQMKKIVNEQNELIKEKGLQLSKNMMARMLLKQMLANQYNALKQQQQSVQNEYTPTGMRGIELMTRQQELVPYDVMDYVPEGFAEVKVELIKKLVEELEKEQEHNYQLKQECAYKESAITNLESRSIKEETLQFRVNIQLQEMQAKLQQQDVMNLNLKEELKDAEHKINRTQTRIMQKSPHFQKSLDGTSNDDACAYKLFLKDKMIQQIELLYDHFNNLNEIMEQKQQDIVNVVTFKKKVSDSLQSLNKKKINMKYYLRELKDHLISIKNQISQISFQCLQHEAIHETKKEKKNRAEQLEKQQQSFHEQRFSIKKILSTLIKNQTTLKKPQIDKITTPRSKSKNQTMIVENQIQAHNILVHKFARQKQGSALNSDNNRSLKKKTFKIQEIPILAQEKVEKIVQMIDEKVKKQIKAFSSQKSSMQTTFRSSSKQKTFTKKLKKFNSQKFFTQNPNSISYRLIERLRQKEDEEIQFLKNQEPNKIQPTKESVIPFSATSSPQIKKISSNFNVYEKSTNYLKNNVKIQQRKVKRLNGETAELISEYEKLRYENKEFSDKQTLINEGIDYLNELQTKQQSIKSLKNDSDSTVKMAWKTPFLHYIDQKSSNVSSNKTLSNFKDNKTTRMMTLFTSRSSKNPFNFASTAFNSPRVTTPIKISQSNSFFKKK